MRIGVMIFINETYKRLLLLWDYKFNMVTQIVMLGFVFVGITLFMSEGQIDQVQIAPVLLGYLVWFYALSAISDMSWGIREETQTGTLEQMYMSPVSPNVLLMGRAFATLINTTIMVVIIAGVLITLFQVSMPMRWAGIPVFLLTMIGLYGFGFMIGGATLIFKQVEALANMAQNMLLFLNGAFLPVERMPDWLAGFAKTLPTTQGIIVLRKVILDGQSLASAWNDGSLVSLVVNSSIYFVGGWLVFRWCERVARQRGALGQY